MIRQEEKGKCGEVALRNLASDLGYKKEALAYFKEPCSDFLSLAREGKELGIRLKPFYIEDFKKVSKARWKGIIRKKTNGSFHFVYVRKGLLFSIYDGAKGKREIITKKKYQKEYTDELLLCLSKRKREKGFLSFKNRIGFYLFPLFQSLTLFLSFFLLRKEALLALASLLLFLIFRLLEDLNVIASERKLSLGMEERYLELTNGKDLPSFERWKQKFLLEQRRKGELGGLLLLLPLSLFLYDREGIIILSGTFVLALLLSCLFRELRRRRLTEVSLREKTLEEKGFEKDEFFLLNKEKGSYLHCCYLERMLLLLFVFTVSFVFALNKEEKIVSFISYLVFPSYLGLLIQKEGIKRESELTSEELFLHLGKERNAILTKEVKINKEKSDL